MEKAMFEFKRTCSEYAFFPLTLCVPGTVDYTIPVYLYHLRISCRNSCVQAKAHTTTSNPTTSVPRSALVLPVRGRYPPSPRLPKRL